MAKLNIFDKKNTVKRWKKTFQTSPDKLKPYDMDPHAVSDAVRRLLEGQKGV